ncbi:MAG: 16S rRNA (guanine(966)-N(2))-methyltransferase RsmD, partial [Candidatus Limnocylindrales bacterium]
RPELVSAALAALSVPGILTPAAVVVVKHGRRTEPPARTGLLASDRERRFGETVLTFYRLAGPDEEGA